jgi:tyrosyl-tRNA synthetase
MQYSATVPQHVINQLPETMKDADTISIFSVIYKQVTGSACVDMEDIHPQDDSYYTAALYATLMQLHTKTGNDELLNAAEAIRQNAYEVADLEGIPLDEIARLSALQGAELNQAKQVLAFAATEIAHGHDAAVAAEQASAALFGGGADMSNVPSVDIEMANDMPILDFLVATGLFPSKSEARRMVEQGAIQIDGEKITDPKFVVAVSDEHMVQKGKKTFLKVVKK